VSSIGDTTISDSVLALGTPHRGGRGEEDRTTLYDPQSMTPGRRGDETLTSQGYDDMSTPRGGGGSTASSSLLSFEGHEMSAVDTDPSLSPLPRQTPRSAATGTPLKLHTIQEHDADMDDDEKVKKDVPTEGGVEASVSHERRGGLEESADTDDDFRDGECDDLDIYLLYVNYIISCNYVTAKYCLELLA